MQMELCVVILMKTGIQNDLRSWIPACAGMTVQDLETSQ
jgi:hypothetical protein